MDLFVVFCWAIIQVATVVVGNVCFYYFFGVRIEQETEDD